MASVRKTTGFVLSMSILASGCTEQDRRLDAVATDSVATISELERTSADEPQLPTNAEDPFAGFGLSPNDVAATSVETPVWLVNETTRALIVTARGGAERVVIDTVAAADSALVELNTRARTLEISARTYEGVTVGTVSLPMDSEPKRAAFPH